MQLKNQLGSVMIYSLLLLAFTSIIGFTMHSLAYMEIKMSLYEHRANQARELAESAALLAMEELNIILRDVYFNVEEFPATIVLENYWSPVFGEDKIIKTGNLILTGRQDDACIYSFTSNGIYKGAKKTLNVQVVVSFAEYYKLQADINGNLKIVFSHREFLDRGRFIVFREAE